MDKQNISKLGLDMSWMIVWNSNQSVKEFSAYVIHIDKSDDHEVSHCINVQVIRNVWCFKGMCYELIS